MTDSTLLVDLQNALSSDAQLPSDDLIQQWSQRAYSAAASKPLASMEVTIRFVDEIEMGDLNSSYRGKQGTTNVLSFPFENEFDFAESNDLNDDGQIESDLLGDIVICHKVIQREAQEQGKTELNHYAHMVTHGVLHLCGYDHIDDADAEEMEALEVKILALSGIENPYT